MIIKNLVIGSFQVNNYLVICEKTREAVLIDASGDYPKTIKAVEENQADLKHILHTHGHMDHIAGDYALQTNNKVKALMHKDDQFLIDSFQSHLKMFGMPSFETPAIDGDIKETEEISVGELKLKVIHTPGHSPGSVCFLVEDTLFSGDTLFADSVGRTDLPGGSFEQLKDSVKNKLFALDDNIKVYPGHGPATTIGHEKANNPFFGRSAKI